MIGAGQRSQARRGGLAALCCAAALAGPAKAEPLFSPPDGCKVYLTVQSKSCKVSHHYICKGDVPGDQWRVDYNRTGPYFISRINAEGEWMQSINLAGGFETRLADTSADRASLSTLMETGTDTYDFAQQGPAGDLVRYRGFDTLTGATVVIDGVELEETSFKFRETTGAGKLLGTASGTEYIHRGWRLFFSGPGKWVSGAGEETIDRIPVRFDLPGDAGFRSTSPEFDCNAQLAALK